MTVKQETTGKGKLHFLYKKDKRMKAIQKNDMKSEIR